MNILKVLQVGVQIGYPGAILVHPMRRQNFAGKSQFLQHLRLCHIGIPFFPAFLGTDLCLCFAVLILLIIWGRQRETIVVIQNFDTLPLKAASETSKLIVEKLLFKIMMWAFLHKEKQRKPICQIKVLRDKIKCVFFQLIHIARISNHQIKWHPHSTWWCSWQKRWTMDIFRIVASY